MTPSPRKPGEGYWLIAIKMERETAKRKGNIKKELELPDGIDASISDSYLILKGPKGEVKRNNKKLNVTIKVKGKKIIFESRRATKKNKKILGSLVAHAKNMVRGCSENHTYVLKICAGHFPMNVSITGDKLNVKNFLGEKVPRALHLKGGASVKVEGVLIYVTSPSKEIAGQVSANIEQLTRRPGFDTRIFQDGIYIINKDGKELK